MNGVRVHLFGRFEVEYEGRARSPVDAAKAQELLCYLVLHRDRPQFRESLADQLWLDVPALQSKKYLRQALWQLHGAFAAAELRPRRNARHKPAAPAEAPLQIPAPAQVDLLLVQREWVQVNPHADLWIDVVAFERALVAAHGVPGRSLDAQRMQALSDAVALYRGELLEGWYQDWCLYEHERLHNLYLACLDKLMDYWEAHDAYELALSHGTQVLRYEPARESTHRRMMRLYFLAGDRTAALRQYQRCVDTLNRSSRWSPSGTVALFEQIRQGQLLSVGLLSPTIERERVQSLLADIQQELQSELRALEQQRSSS